MKKLVLHIVSVILAFFAGMGMMTYVTRMGNRDMTAEMASAALPVVYIEWDGRLCNEMHGYVEEMDGSYMKDYMIGLSEDHELKVAVEKYNAQIESISYEVRSMNAERLIEGQENLDTQDDGKYLRVSLEIKDLLERGENYLLIVRVQTREKGEVSFYSQLKYLGSNHVKECVAFMEEFHRVTVEKDVDSSLLSYLEPNGTMDGQNLGYVNIHSRSGPVTWGDMNIQQVTDSQIRFTELEPSSDTAAAVFSYQIENLDTEELYQVEEAIRVRYTASRMYLLAYERTAEKIFQPDKQLLVDQKIAFGIQNQELNYRKNEEENVIGFVQQGQLWSYDFGQNRLSLVYGFVDGEDHRNFYNAHDFRILNVEDSGNMNFLIYGYMDRGNYEGRSGVLLCRYDALLNTVEEQAFIPSKWPYQIVRENLGNIAVENESGKAWISYADQVLQIDLRDCSVKVMAEYAEADQMKMSEDGALVAWSSQSGDQINLLNTQNGVIHAIEAGEGEMLRVLGFMEKDFLYGIVRKRDVLKDQGGQNIYPMYRIVIRDHSGKQIREFDYESKGKYVTAISMVENRIDLSCIHLTGENTYKEALPEPITYTSEQTKQILQLLTVKDPVKRLEYQLSYAGNARGGSLKRPKVKLVLAEESRDLQLESCEEESFYAYSFQGTAGRYQELSKAILAANEGMGTVWKGSDCVWSRGGRRSRVLLDGFSEPEQLENEGSVLAQCLQMLFRQKQIYRNVQQELDAGKEVWEICREALGDSACILTDCTLDMTLYYVSQGAPVLGLTENGAVLVIGYDAQNIFYYSPQKQAVQKMGKKDAAAMFENSGNLFFSYI